MIAPTTSAVGPAMCGVVTTPGTPTSGWSRSAGSALNTSVAAPSSRPSATAAATADSSRGKGDREHQHVAAGNQIVERRVCDTVRLDVLVPGPAPVADVDLEGCEPGEQGPRDATHPDDADAPTTQFPPQSAEHSPLALLERRVGVRESAQGVDHRPHDPLGDSDRVEPGRRRHGDAVGTYGLEVEPVEPGRRGLDQPAGGCERGCELMVDATPLPSHEAMHIVAPTAAARASSRVLAARTSTSCTCAVTASGGSGASRST